MRHIAIIGSGPAGYYTAEAAQKLWGEEVQVDIFDMLPVPYGLIRSGVAPDHQSIKAVYRRYEGTSLSQNVRFIGNVMVGKDISVAELQELYDAVVLATGAPHDKKVGLPGEDLGNVFGSAAFVGWYNGHPDFADLGPDFSGNNAVLSCFDAKAGQPFFTEQRVEGPSGFYASPVGAGGRVYLAGRNGTSVVLKESDKFEILATNRLDEKFDASPAVVGKELFLRGHEYLYCLSEK